MKKIGIGLCMALLALTTLTVHAQPTPPGLSNSVPATPIPPPDDYFVLTPLPAPDGKDPAIFYLCDIDSSTLELGSKIWVGTTSSSSNTMVNPYNPMQIIMEYPDSETNATANWACYIGTRFHLTSTTTNVVGYTDGYPITNIAGSYLSSSTTGYMAAGSQWQSSMIAYVTNVTVVFTNPPLGTLNPPSVVPMDITNDWDTNWWDTISNIPPAGPLGGLPPNLWGLPPFPGPGWFDIYGNPVGGWIVKHVLETNALGEITVRTIKVPTSIDLDQYPLLKGVTDTAYVMLTSTNSPFGPWYTVTNDIMPDPNGDGGFTNVINVDSDGNGHLQYPYRSDEHLLGQFYRLKLWTNSAPPGP